MWNFRYRSFIVRYNFFGVESKIEDETEDLKTCLNATAIYIIDDVVDDVKDKIIDDIDDIAFFDVANEVNIIFIINVDKDISILMIIKRDNIDDSKVDLEIFLL